MMRMDFRTEQRPKFLESRSPDPARSSLKAVLAMPAEKMRVRIIPGQRRKHEPPGLVDHAADAIGVVDLARDQNFKTIGDRKQTAVEHPMGSPG